MPPLIGRELPDSRVERTIAVGLLPREGTKRYEIIGVRMGTREILRFGPTERGRAPAIAAAHNPICGLPYAAQQTIASVGLAVAGAFAAGVANPIAPLQLWDWLRSSYSGFSAAWNIGSS